jgi:hypothetical protein
MFGNWVAGVDKKERAQIWVGVCAFLWALWNVQNDYIFNRAKQNSFMQVIPLATHWIRMWSFLQLMDKRQEMDFRCNRLELVAWDLYNQSSWRFDLRLTYWCICIICFFLYCLDGWYMYRPYATHDVIHCNTQALE